ncbi:MAG: tetratricopeptide repeat protein [Alphaproteobacteria bacterium]
MAVQRKRKAATEPSPTTPDPIEIAMEALASGRAPTGVAEEVLRKQSHLLGWQIASERVGYALKVLTMVAGAGVALVAALLIWQASRADGLVITAFSVPPALTEQGMSGEVLAGRLLDDISTMAEVSRSAERQRGLAADWDNNVTVEIAQTGISVGQVEQWLRRKLGHETRLSGAVTRGHDGKLQLITRVGFHAIPPQTGADADLPALLQTAAEAIYQHEQPVSYIGYLARMERNADAAAAARLLIARPDAATQATGYVMLGNASQRIEGTRAAIAAYEQALAIDPVAHAAAGGGALAGFEYNAGHYERSLTLTREDLRLIRSSRAISPEARRQKELAARQVIALRTGDYAQSLVVGQQLAGTSRLGFAGAEATGYGLVAQSYAALHDGARARAEMARWEPRDEADMRNKLAQGNFMNRMAEDWPAMLAVLEQQRLTCIASTPDNCAMNYRNPALIGLGLLKLGRFEEAHASVDSLPVDCFVCVIVRGQLAAAEGKAAEADRYFADAVKLAPSLPDANYEWGRALLARGDAVQAEARLRAALKASPHYADPMTYLGEALLAQNKPGPAIAQFKKADRIAPHWGRNHLLWGKALAAQGKTTEAKAKWRTASGLDLTADERAQLAKAEAHA